MIWNLVNVKLMVIFVCRYKLGTRNIVVYCGTPLGIFSSLIKALIVEAYGKELTTVYIYAVSASIGLFAGVTIKCVTERLSLKDRCSDDYRVCLFSTPLSIFGDIKFNFIYL